MALGISQRAARSTQRVVKVNSKTLETISCRGPDEIIEAIRSRIRESSSDYGRYGRPYRWIYRGQANADWKLVPTALRPGVTLGFYPDRKQYTSTGHGSSPYQRNGELVAVRQFAEVTDRIGLPVPGIHPNFRRYGSDLGLCKVNDFITQFEIQDWPQTEMLELLAIAQHHGVPTRLLDFTYDPLVALFFAADDAASNYETHQQIGVKELAVWCLDIQYVYRMHFPLRLVEVERARNPFLFAQKGLFLFEQSNNFTPTDVITPSFDEHIESYLSRSGIIGTAMLKFTLPIEYANDALELLSCVQIDRPHLMPTYDNVVGYLKSRDLSTQCPLKPTVDAQ